MQYQQKLAISAKYNSIIATHMANSFDFIGFMLKNT